MPKNLQVLNVTSISNEECRKQVRIVHDSHLCTLNQAGHGICGVRKFYYCEGETLFFIWFLEIMNCSEWLQGDSGSSLVSNNNELVGIVNWAFTLVTKSDFRFFKIIFQENYFNFTFSDAVLVIPLDLPEFPIYTNGLRDMCICIESVVHGYCCCYCLAEWIVHQELIKYFNDYDLTIQYLN